MKLARAVALIGLLSCLTASAADWSSKLPFEQKSRFFEIRYQRAQWDAAGFGRFADGFVDLVNRDFLKVEFDYPIQVLVLPDRASFQQFLKKELGVDDPPDFGIYFRAFKVFATYENSGLGTFAHEIMHPLVDRNLRDCPVWATEAIPAFFEKFIGYWAGDQLQAQWGFQSPWRLEAIGSKLTSLDLTRIVTDKRAVTNFNNSERRLVTVFLWRQGKLERFMQLIAGRDKAGYRSYLEAAMELSLKEIVPLWQGYLAEIEAHRAEAMQVPGSTVLANRPTFERVMAHYKPWLQERIDRKAAPAN